MFVAIMKCTCVRTSHGTRWHIKYIVRFGIYPGVLKKKRKRENCFKQTSSSVNVMCAGNNPAVVPPRANHHWKILSVGCLTCPPDMRHADIGEPFLSEIVGGTKQLPCCTAHSKTSRRPRLEQSLNMLSLPENAQMKLLECSLGRRYRNLGHIETLCWVLSPRTRERLKLKLVA
jgi:hypothetical protein